MFTIYELIPGQKFLNRRLDEEYGGLAHWSAILIFETGTIVCNACLSLKHNELHLTYRNSVLWEIFCFCYPKYLEVLAFKLWIF